jgi:hypothetical protein
MNDFCCILIRCEHFASRIEAKNYQDGYMSKSLLLTCSLVSAFFIPSAHALVDYSNTVGGVEEKAPANRSMQKMSAASNSGGGRGLTWKSDFSFTTNYESLEIESNKYGVLNLNAHVQTPVNIYLDATYWNADGNEGSSSGNPRLILGFNWLRFGSPSEEAKLDIYGGVKLSSSSLLGSSRTDKIFGAETTKRFGTFGIGIGYDMTLVGNAKNTDEKTIGNINRLNISGGWMVSEDIQFEIEAENYSIAPGDESRTNRLIEKVSFSTLSPKLNLGLAPAINLELGARFRMKKVKEDSDLMAAKVFDLHGVHSNSLFAGLNITL